MDLAFAMLKRVGGIHLSGCMGKVPLFVISTSSTITPICPHWLFPGFHFQALSSLDQKTSSLWVCKADLKGAPDLQLDHSLLK